MLVARKPQFDTCGDARRNEARSDSRPVYPPKARRSANFDDLLKSVMRRTKKAREYLAR